MRFHKPLVKVLALIVLLLAVVTPSRANALHVRGGSNYGKNSSFSDCVAGTVTTACEAFDLTPTIVSFNGLSYSVFQFVIGNTGVPGTVFNVIDLGSLAANSTFSLPPAFFVPTVTEVFSCDDHSNLFQGNQFLFDSGNAPMTGPCTPSLTTPPDIGQNGVSFTTGPNFNVFNLVLDAPANVSTPEPASLVLLGVGLLAVGRKFRRSR